MARAVWVAAIIVVCVPFLDFHGHTHWAKVAWIPFVSPPIKTPDLLANVALYLPFGFLWAQDAAAPRALRGIILAAAVLSISVEFSQLFSHSRFPSSTDVVCNVIGAVAGLNLRRAWDVITPRASSQALFSGRNFPDA
jgi:glycopeptide antibiotics resistance protein